jgi:uncharacterized alkaline shock family protein YloU
MDPTTRARDVGPRRSAQLQARSGAVTNQEPRQNASTPAAHHVHESRPTGSPDSIDSADSAGAAGVMNAADVAGRGSLTMSEKVIEKLAAQSAHELPFLTGVGGGVLGLGRTHGTDRRPQATVNLSGRNVTVFLDVALGFPSDIAARSAEIRRHVTASIEQATGLDVRRIDITIKALTPHTERSRRSLL